MREEDEIMEELHGLDGELKSFPTGAHWFCPRRHKEDHIDYDNPDEPEEDMSLETKHQLIEDAKRRHKVAYRYSLILGLAPEVSGTLSKDYIDQLDEQLTTCDKCVHNWHMGRKPYLKELAEQFDDDTVAALSNMLNEADFRRLDAGLDEGAKILASVEPQQRTQSVLAKSGSQAALLALYEALCCVDYHKSNETLAKHFDFVFQQVQTRKVLRIADTLPAMARFLFDSDPWRLRFATTAWQKGTTNLTPETFDWVVHDVLSEAIVSVSLPTAEPAEIQRFWEGFLLMLDKMDESLITHSLRGLEVQPDIYQLILQHFPTHSDEIVLLLITVLRRLLQKSSKNFWEAMGTISPATVAEQIFASPAFEKLLAKSQGFVQDEQPPATAWISELIDSLQPVHQHDACRSLLYHLLERLQDTRFSQNARFACCRAGLNALCTTLSTFLKPGYQINPTTSLIVINDIMRLVNTYKSTIVGCADIVTTDKNHPELKRLGMLVIQDALAVDCKALSAEYYALEAGTPVQRSIRTDSQSIWQAVLDIFRPGNVELAKSILAATSPLTGLDELLPRDKKTTQLPKDHAQFNEDFKQLNDNISRVFERLSDFEPSDLREMYRQPKTSRYLCAALVSADQAIYESAVAVVKTMTGEASRHDAFRTLLEGTFSPALNAISHAVSPIIKARTYSPVPHMLKIGREILDALCGSTGILRTKSAWSDGERNTVMLWWTLQWKSLEMVFSSTEKWARRVAVPTAAMEDFCRDAMDYAEALFDQHNIIASIFREASPDADQSLTTSGSSKESIRKILEIPCHNVNGLTMMIRLRDAYLISIITRLLTKLLRCLGEYDLEIDDFASKFIKDACKLEYEVGFKKTNLTNQQKAELRRTLEEHQGIEILEVPPTIKKQSTIDSWSRSADGQKNLQQASEYSDTSSSTVKKQSTIDSWSKSAGGQKYEPTLPPKSHGLQPTLAERQKAALQLKASTMSTQERDRLFLQNRRKAEEEKKRLNAEAVAKLKANSRSTALVRGEGSGIKDIGGVAGKDHAPVRSEIMVGSSDEESDDEDEDETNALVKTRKETSKQVKEYEESRRHAMQKMQQGPVRKTKTQRSAKDLRARVEPNMDRLYLEILNWDIFHQGDQPPSNNECRRIADKFLDLDLYKVTFGPLLISEVWRSLVAAKDENTFKPVEIKVLNRLSVDKFMEVSTSMPMAFNKELKMAERDIVLLSRSPDPLNNKQEPHCLARVDRTTRKKETLEITYRVSRDLNPAFLQCLAPNGKIHVIKIADMTTTQREFAALSSLDYYDLCNEVLQAEPSPIQRYSEEKISQMASKYTLNKGQAQAILSAHDNDGFTLIQGPPGSGKTKTIVAMVGALLTGTLQEQREEQARAKPQIQAPGNPKPAAPAPKKKLLICAPSNAAVDELVVRLKEGIVPLNGPRQKINVIRIGRSDAINASVKDVMLDELVRMKLEGDNGEKNKLLQDRDKLHQEAAKIKERLNQIRPQMDAALASADKALELKLRKEFDLLKRNQAHIGTKIDEDKESGNTVSRQNEINRRRFQQEIIDGAHVLCATLSGSGHDMFRNLNVEFETVVIDEAAQCIELSALIPLKYGCTKCILVGDPEQLPPTVLSRSAQSFGYEQSLFVRMQRNHPKDVHLLDTQYRMHPEISSFPSKQFYKSRLVDGDGMATLRAKPWHASTILGPYRFFDVEGVQTKEARGHSFINVPELNAAIRLYERLKADYRSVDFTGKIGIITTYKAQLIEMRMRFARKFGDDIFKEIEFNTTDAFQGREREIIIFSCVRAKASGGIGFLGDIRRMNVGLTRAKSSLWVLGDSRSLKQGEFWNRLIEDAKDRDRYSSGDVMGLLSKPSARNNPALPSHKRSTLSAQASAVLVSDKSYPTAAVKGEDSDVEMVDAPQSAPSSRNSPIGGDSVGPSEAIANPTLDRTVKQEPRKISVGAAGEAAERKASIGGTNPSGIKNLHGKRPREGTITDEGAPIKKAPPSNGPSKGSSGPDLEAALAAHQAAKPAPVRPPGGAAGVMPPRRKAPADPFIQRKPPRRR